MIRIAQLASLLLLGACDFNPDKALDLLSGREVNLVVLTKEPLRITADAMTFTSSEPMRVVGELTTVCFALRGEIPLQDSTVMDRHFADAMQGAKVTVTAALANGDRVKLRQPLQAWSRNGNIVKNDELSACAGTPCKTELPVGAQVSRIEVSSEPALQVLGVYWESERSVLEAQPIPPARTAAASAPKAKTSCSA